MFSTPTIPAAPAAVAGASTTVAVARAADVDDAVAVAATTAEGLVAAGRSLRFALRAVDSWRADRGHAGCLCRAADELRIAARLVDGITPLTLRRSATWRDPLDDVLYPVGSITRVLGRTARLLRSLARGGAPYDGTAAPDDVRLGAEACAQARTAWEHTFHALVRLRAVQEAHTWFPNSPVDPWLLLAAEVPPYAACRHCDPGPGDPEPDGPASAAGTGHARDPHRLRAELAEVIPIERGVARAGMPATAGGDGGVRRSSRFARMAVARRLDVGGAERMARRAC